jgi:hypothetical protein
MARGLLDDKLLRALASKHSMIMLSVGVLTEDSIEALLSSDRSAALAGYIQYYLTLKIGNDNRRAMRLHIISRAIQIAGT